MKTNRIFEYLDELFPNARCELNYSKDYELLIAVMLSAQTTDKRVNIVTEKLFSKYPTLALLSQAKLSDVEDILKPIGTYRIKAKNVINIANKLVEKPVCNNRDYLESLPGVGRKTTNVILSELYNEPYLAVDTHVNRVAKRLNLANENDNVLIVEKKLVKLIPKNKINKLHHQLIFFGRYHCKAIKPSCSICKLSDLCKYKKRNMN